jgi:hypothetical protein
LIIPLLSILLSCNKSKKDAEPELKVSFGYNGIEDSIHTPTKCLELQKFDLPDSIQTIVERNFWLDEGDIELIKKFYGKTSEVVLLKNQVGIDDEKDIYYSNSSNILLAFFRKNIAIIERRNLEYNETERIRYVFDLYNNGKLNETIHFQTLNRQYLLLANRKGKYEIQRNELRRLEIQNGDNKINLNREIPVGKAFLDYYLVVIDNPCSEKQTIRKPILIQGDIEVFFKDI